MNRDNTTMFIFLSLIIGMSLLSLYKPTTMANAQVTSADANRGESGRQIGICLWRVKSLCNSDSDLDSHR